MFGWGFVSGGRWRMVCRAVAVALCGPGFYFSHVPLPRERLFPLKNACFTYLKKTRVFPLPYVCGPLL